MGREENRTGCMYNYESYIGRICGYKIIKYVDRFYSQWKYNL